MDLVLRLTRNFLWGALVGRDHDGRLIDVPNGESFSSESECPQQLAGTKEYFRWRNCVILIEINDMAGTSQQQWLEVAWLDVSSLEVSLEPLYCQLVNVRQALM